jgi:hypothetical protein
MGRRESIESGMRGRWRWGIGVVFWAWAMGSALEAKPRTPIRVENVNYEYRPESSFKGISEGLTGRTNLGFRTFVFGEKREGGYMRVEFNHSIKQLPKGGTLTLYYFDEGRVGLKTRVWCFDKPYGSWFPELYLPLVFEGEKVPSAKMVILAWHAVLRDKEGRVVSERKSFGWEMPDAVPKRFRMKK